MTVARDAHLESATFTTTTPRTFLFTPVGTPRGILVFVAHGEVSTDLVNGTVSYGGVAMTRVPTNGFAQDTVDEPGAVYAYFLGASIPTGPQTVSLGHTGSANVKWAIAASMTAAANTEIGASGRLQENQANPQIALDTGANSSLRYCIIYHGHSAPSALAVISGMEANTSAENHDFGAFAAQFGLQTTASTGSFTIGYTGISDDCAMIAVAIQEVGGAVTRPPRPTVVNFAVTRASSY